MHSGKWLKLMLKSLSESEVVKNIRYDNQILISKLREYKKLSKNVSGGLTRVQAEVVAPLSQGKPRESLMQGLKLPCKRVE
jgi:hypothetical protein